MIAVDDLVFGYRAPERIVDHLTYGFPPGTVTGVTGPSGRGKSTVLYLIGLLLAPTSGGVVVDDVDVSSWSDRKRSRFRASRVGFVFQDAALDNTRSVLDNIIETTVYNRIPRRTAVDKAYGLMERFGVALRHDHKPGEVSGGQAQRIALCRALLAQPDIVLADEPTGNLDVETAQVVIDALAELAYNENRTVIIASHDPTVVSACGRVLEL